MSISTHVLDAVTGRPATGVSVTLESRSDLGWVVVAQQQTNADGRITDFGADAEVGVFRLGFATDAYFDGATFYPEVHITFRVVDADVHHHVPLLLSPFAYSTYRGS